MLLKLFSELVGNIFTLIGAILLGIMLIIAVVIAFHYYPLTTGIIGGLWVLCFILSLIDTSKKSNT